MPGGRAGPCVQLKLEKDSCDAESFISVMGALRFSFSWSHTSVSCTVLILIHGFVTDTLKLVGIRIRSKYSLRSSLFS